MTAPLTTDRSNLPGPLRLFNAAARGASKLGLRGRPLSAERILDTARRRTKLDDLGDGADDVLEALQVLAESFECDAALTPFGRVGIRDMLERQLVRRLQIVEQVRTRPEVSDETIRRPLFVIGLPRTGTTLLFNLLAQDPDARPLLGWESFQPVAPRRARAERSDPRIGEYRRALRLLNYVSPELQKVHSYSADGPEECIALLMRTLITWTFDMLARIPRYDAWLWSRERPVLEAAYRFHRDQLRLIQTQRAGGHWLLKSPAHLNGLAALARVYPDATIVQTHRDPIKVFPSTSSLYAVVRGIYSDRVEPREIGRDTLSAGRRTLDRLLEVRRSLPEARVADVRYADLVDDPVKTVERIYDRIGRACSEQMKTGMERWIEANPRHKHGAHRYDLEQFGLDRGEIERISAAYRERFEIPAES